MSFTLGDLLCIMQCYGIILCFRTGMRMVPSCCVRESQRRSGRLQEKTYQIQILCRHRDNSWRGGVPAWCWCLMDLEQSLPRDILCGASRSKTRAPALSRRHRGSLGWR